MALIVSVAGFAAFSSCSNFVAGRVDESYRLLSDRRPLEAIAVLSTAKLISKILRCDTVRISYALGRGFLESNQTDEAIRHLEDTIVVAPAFWAAKANLASAYFDRGEIQRALGAVQDAIEIVEKNGASLPFEDAPPMASKVLLAELYLQKGHCGPIIREMLVRAECASWFDMVRIWDGGLVTLISDPPTSLRQGRFC